MTFFADKLTLLRIGENVDSVPEILEMFRERPNGDKPSPEYFDAEERYRAAKSPGEKISCIEELLRIVPKHKGTDKLRQDYANVYLN